MIQLECGNCGKMLSIPEQYAGQRGKCNGCGGPVEVPGLEEELTEGLTDSQPNDEQAINARSSALGIIDDPLDNPNSSFKIIEDPKHFIAGIVGGCIVMFFILIGRDTSPDRLERGTPVPRQALVNQTSSEVSTQPEYVPPTSTIGVPVQPASIAEPTESTAARVRGINELQATPKTQLYDVSVALVSTSIKSFGGTELTVAIRNDTPYYLDYVSFSATLYGSRGEYLDTALFVANRLQPGDETTDDATFMKIASSSYIHSWILRMEIVSLDNSDLRTENFRIVEVNSEQ